MLRYQACGLSLHRYLGPTCGPSGRSQDRAAAPARWSGNVVVAQGTNGPGRPAHPLSRNAGGGSRTAAAVVGAAGPMVDRGLRLGGLRGHPSQTVADLSAQPHVSDRFWANLGHF